MTSDDLLTLWDTIKQLYSELIRAEADRAALLQILREELHESSPEIMNRLGAFRTEEFYQRQIREREQIFPPIEEFLRAGKERELLEALAKMPVSKSVN